MRRKTFIYNASPPRNTVPHYHIACLLHTFTMQPQKPTVTKHILLSASPHVL